MIYAFVMAQKNAVQDPKNGEWFIPASQRPDGSWRKSIKVKEGYVPPEEMERYQNKNVQWFNSKPSLPVGLAPMNDVTSSNLSKAAKKNQKRRKKQTQGVDDISVQVSEIRIHAPHEKNPEEKRLKSLKKKLKSIVELQEAIECGKVTNPDPDQIAKINRKAEVEAEVVSLQIIVDNALA